MQNVSTRIEHIQQVISLLKMAKRHAFFAVRSETVTHKDDDFLHFIDLISNNVEAIHSMLEHQIHLGEEESFLCQFLDTTPGQCTLPAMRYRRQSDDLLENVCNLLRLAHTPYITLQQESQKSMPPQELGRYKRAYKQYQEELRT
ncbi:MAG: hypothetical protein GKR87_12470 [Kiritimatiellae bacterium]|nr:hypothetical protein [Kiritimatiellia bacterium]